MGISKDGHFAALTNYLVHIKDFKEKTKGRGLMYIDYIELMYTYRVCIMFPALIYSFYIRIVIHIYNVIMV